MPRIWLQLSGLFLVAVGYMLVYAARHEVTQFIFIGIGSCFVRFGYAAVVIVTLMTSGIEWVYVLGGFTDGLTGLIILVAILRAGELKTHKLI